MDEAVSVARREALTRLRVFCSGLIECLQQGGFTAEQVFAIFESSIAAECIQCRIQVSGKELFEVGMPAAEGQQPGPKIARMRLGDCARQGCDSMYCNIAFQPYPRVDWQAVIGRAESRELAESGVLHVKAARRRLPRVNFTPHGLRRTGLLAGAIVLLIAARQYYYGGRIPLIREPERFRVDHVASTPGTTDAPVPEYLRE